MSASAMASDFSPAKISKLESFNDVKSSTALRNLAGEYTHLLSSPSIIETAQKPSESDLNPEWVSIDTIPNNNVQFMRSYKSVKTVAKFKGIKSNTDTLFEIHKTNKHIIFTHPTRDAFDVWKSLLFRDKIWNLITFAKSKTMQNVSINEKTTASSQNLKIIRNFQNLNDKQNMAENFKKKKENFKDYLQKLNCESRKKHNLFPKSRVTQIHARFEERIPEEKHFQEKYILFSDPVKKVNKLVPEAKFWEKYEKNSHNGSLTHFCSERGTLDNDKEYITEAIKIEKDRYHRVDTMMELQKEFKDLRQSKVAQGTGRKPI